MPPTRALPLAALAASTLLLAACTTGSPSGSTTTSEPADDDLTPVTVGLLTITPSAAIQYGIDEGIFAEHGLDVSVQAAQGGAAMLPAVSTGQIDFGVGNPLSVLIAAGEGVDMRIASGYSASLADGDDINAIVTRAGDDITTWQDLAGKKVAVNTVNGQGDLTIMGSVQADGGDPGAVEFLEVAFPDALAQLDSENVDAVWIPEPFLSAAVADPDKYSVLGYPNQNTLPGLPTMVTFTSGSLADENPELVTTWREAVTEVLDAATADHDGFATTIAEFTGMPEDAAANLRLERLSADLDPQVLTDLGTLATQFEFVENQPDLDTIILD
ncbi:ABC transporter substrate-binding protein [Myceligenerans halotolerans]